MKPHVALLLWYFILYQIVDSILNSFVLSLNIQALLGYRSGSKCLKPNISLDDYNRIREKFKKEEKLFLDQFYELDENYIEDFDFNTADPK